MVAVGRSGLSPAIVAQRVRFHLVYRLVVRAEQAFFAKQRSSLQSPRLCRAAAACAVGDLIVGVCLRRSDRFALAPRLVLDASDAALWSLSTNDYYDEAVLTGVPLALEAGARLGVFGLVVPAANAAMTALVRKQRRRRLRLGAFKWQVIAVAGGVALAWYEERRTRAVQIRRAQELEAQLQQAHLRGQNDVAMGADTVVDLLTRTTPLLAGNHPAVLTGARLAQWRAALAAESAQGSSYLGSSIRQWERQHNQHPDLAGDVLVHLREGDGALLLTATQAMALHERLDQLPLRGSVTVEVAERDKFSLPGMARLLHVNGRTVEIPADPLSSLEPFDPGPMILAVSPAWFGVQALRSFENAPIMAVLPSGVLALALAAWGHVSIEGRGQEAHPPIVAGALGISLLNALLVTPTMRRPLTDEGLDRLPAINGLVVVGLLVSLYINDLNSAQRRLILSVVALVLGSSLILGPKPIQWGPIAMTLLWPVSAFLSALGLHRGLGAEAAALAAQLAEADEVEVQRAFAQGRSSVIALVADARVEAWRLFEAVKDDLSETVRVEANARMREVDLRLEALQCADE